MDCLLGIQKMLEHGIRVDLIVTDPPYYIKSTNISTAEELFDALGKDNQKGGNGKGGYSM